MSNTFGKDDCKHYEERVDLDTRFSLDEGGCSINKGCGSGGGYCRPLWTGEACYTQEKPGDNQLAEFGHQIYAHGDTIVLRGKDGKCWQLTCGDYMGELPKGELIFIKRALLSD